MFHELNKRASAFRDEFQKLVRTHYCVDFERESRTPGLNNLQNNIVTENKYHYLDGLIWH